jgi:hypothetical protein
MRCWRPLQPERASILTKELDHWMILQGQITALEAAVTQLAFRWGISQPHPPTALSDFLRPLEEDAKKMSADPGNHPVAMQAMSETIRGIAEALEAGLHQAALLRTTSENSGRA